VNEVMTADARELLSEQEFAAFQQIQKENAEKLKTRLKAS
jgi:hypothetical protein